MSIKLQVAAVALVMGAAEVRQQLITAGELLIACMSQPYERLRHEHEASRTAINVDDSASRFAMLEETPELEDGSRSQRCVPVRDGRAFLWMEPSGSITWICGIETPAREDFVRFDRMRKIRTSNNDWKSPAPDARVAKMKDGSTRLAHKAEHAVDLDSGVGDDPAFNSMTTVVPCASSEAMSMNRDGTFSRFLRLKSVTRSITPDSLSLGVLRSGAVVFIWTGAFCHYGWNW
jgi:hypothetical protein